ncbi:MAG: hypothetical protein Q7R33_09575 [Nitrosarchaeum sp.]|nr:hypothetical protein [Nitrosarchaeum sp.]
MNHIAVIQTEFLKEARKWSDLSLEEQKGYLSRHPKSRRKLTAGPTETQSQAPVQSNSQKFSDLGDLSQVDAKLVENGKHLKVQSKQSHNPNHLTLIPDKGGYRINITSGTIENPNRALNATWYDWQNKIFTPEEVRQELKKMSEKKEVKSVEQPAKKLQDWPEQEITNSFNSFNFDIPRDDQRVTTYKSKDGKFQSIGKDTRYLGNWISHPGEEDDDQPDWSRDSEKKYTEMFESWVKRQSWYNPKTMDIFINPSEKAWVEFGVSSKRD